MRIHRYIFFVFLLFLPTQLGYHTWPEWSYILGRRIDYLSPTLFFTDVLLAALFLFWGIDAVSRPGHLKKFAAEIFIYLRHAPLVSGLMLFVLLNTAFSVNQAVTLYAWVKCAEAILLALYIVRTKPDSGRVVFFLAFSVLYSSLLAITQFMLQHSVGGVLWFIGERTFSGQTPGIAQIPFCFPMISGCPLILRSYATFPHPNVLGGFIAVLLPILFYQYKHSKQPVLRYIYATSIIAGLIALISTFSRSAWIVGGIGIAVFMIFRRHAWSPKLLIVPTIILATGAAFYTVRSTLRFTDESVVERVQLAFAAVRLWLIHPLLGVGLGNFLTVLPSVLPSRFVYILQPVHSIYLLVLTETGIAGSFLFLYCLYGIIRFLKTHAFRSGGVINASTVYMLSLSGLFVLGLGDHYILTIQQGRLLAAVIIGLLFSRT